MRRTRGRSRKNPNEFQGTIEAEEVGINAKIPGRIEEIKVEEGQEIQEGDIIALIDIKDILAKKKGWWHRQMQPRQASKQQKHNMMRHWGSWPQHSATLEKAVNGARSQEIAKARPTMTS